MRHSILRVGGGGIAMALMLAGTQAQAQAQAQAAPPDTTAQNDRHATIADIIVTARKRSENDLSVPATISVVTSERMQVRGVTSFADLATITPGVIIGNSLGMLGGVASIRGIGAAASDPIVDQAVGLTIDGVSLANGQAIRFSQFDIERVEILKGPQALYFGKNSTAGIIAVTTAGPTDVPYAMARVGYEFGSRQGLGEAVVSGPIADTLSGRVAFSYSDQRGFYSVPNNEGRDSIVGPIQERSANHVDNTAKLGARVSLRWKPSDRLTINLKGTVVDNDGASSVNFLQLFSCAEGVPNPSSPNNIPNAQDCRLDKIAIAEAKGPTSIQFPNVPGLKSDGRHYEKVTQYLISNDVSYTPSDKFSLNSVTSYYDQRQSQVGAVSMSPLNLAISADKQYRWDVTQELRLTSQMDGPLNFMVGGYYQRGNLYQQITNVLFQSFKLPGSYYFQKSRTLAGFGNLFFDVTDTIKLTAGGRYSYERKRFKPIDNVTGLPNPIEQDTLSTKAFSPEVTASWRPERNTNLFISYRKGTKSGGFNASPSLMAVTTSDIYKDERAQGVEGGIKTIVAGGTLRFDLTAFYYKYSDLQLGFIDPIRVVNTTRNAASAKSRGFELSTEYLPPFVHGLTLSADVSYTRARFGGDAAAECYTGQSVDQGCSLNPLGAGGPFTAQSIAGQQLPRAPDWSGSITANYEADLSSSLRGGILIGASYRDSYNPVTELPPATRQRSAWTFDATARLTTADRRWELAIVGKNLTDRLRVQNGFAALFTPDATGALAKTGTQTGGEGADYVGYPNDPRSVQLRLTWRPQIR